MTAFTRRFIAGATCPKCQLIDKIVVYRDAHSIETCECVRCGYKQYQEQQEKPGLAKVGKREQVVKIIRPQRG